MNKTEHKTNNIGSICNRKRAPLANYTVTENVLMTLKLTALFLICRKFL